jgi:sec-independent protein translocase protein TatA
MGRFGVTEILILLGIALLFFGGSRIASIGKGLGEGIKNFKKGIKEGDGADDEDAPKLSEGTKIEGSLSEGAAKPTTEKT